jgi:hypothetical protein
VLDRDASDWRLNDVNLPTMQVVRRTSLSDVINLLGTASVLAVSADGQKVYVETARIVGPARWDQQLGTGQPDTDYSIAVYDVAQGAFVRSIPLERPWCGVASLFALPDGQLLVRCPTARDVRWIDTRLGKQVASTSVGGVGGVLSRDGHSFWMVAENAHLFEIDIAKRAVTRSSELSDGLSQTLPFQQPHLSADGRRLFVRAAPDSNELWYHGLGTVVWIIDTNTLQRITAVRLPAPAYDMAPSPDGRTLIISTLNTDKRDEWGSRLIDIATGQELGRWPWMQIGMQAKSSN